jgi:cell division protein FtsB
LQPDGNPTHLFNLGIPLGLQKKRVIKNIFIISLFLGLIIAWLGFGERGFYNLYKMDQERQSYLEKIRRLEEANRELLEQIDRLRKDKDYIESVARRELNLIKKDEIIYRFNQEKDEASKDEASKDGASKDERTDP